MTSIRSIYDWLNDLGFLQGKTTDQAADVIANALTAYWRAIRSVVPDAFGEPNKYVIQKTPGLFALHWVLRDHLLPTMFAAHIQWTEDEFRKLLEYSPESCNAEFWDAEEDRAAAYGSMKGFRQLANELIDSLKSKP
ncbi:MAG: hypothetical protein EXR48_00535 [Dehalococcoidia bacterium]|nr:hypothetical protein [Dehalococcoidia bacterium]